jgi:hypothetical protein
MKCAWHQTEECLEESSRLLLQQTIPQADAGQDLARAHRVFATDNYIEFYTELGVFCTTSALLSWLEANTGAMKQTTRELHGAGPGAKRRKGGGDRPTVTKEGTRRQR